MKNFTITIIITIFFVANIFTQKDFNCGDTFTDPRDGQTYSTIQIGEQCWMAENLNIGTMINGTEDMTDNGIIEKYCYDNSATNCDEYGGLYQWNEMMQYTTTQEMQGICPFGWYIPTDTEWAILEGNADSQYPVGDPIWGNIGWRGYDAGLNLKSTSGWYSNGNGTNLYGFTMLPSGMRYNGNFVGIESYTFLWTSSSSGTDAWRRHMQYDYNNTGRYYDPKENAFAVRCLKEEIILGADFSADPVEGFAPLIVQFSDLSAGNPTSWQWDFNYDGTIDSEEQNPEWTFNEPGIYSVSLTVSDGTNEDTQTKEDYITVVEPVQADFFADPVEGFAPLIVQFSDLSAGNPTSWQWDFDNDGTIDSEDQNPEWIYIESGTYTVSLTVSDGVNTDIEIMLDYVTVESSIIEGLIAYYPFTGNANDLSGNEHHGTNFGATLTTDRFGNADNAYDFDGSSDYMNLGNWFNYQDFTISMWVNRETIGANWIVLIDNNHPYNWVIQSYQTSNDFSFGLYPDGGVDFTIELNQWDHVVCIKSGTSIKSYIDGVFQNESTMSSTVNYSNPNLFISRWGGGGRFFDGKIDDIRMFDRALSDNEIQMLYNEPPPLNADFAASSTEIVIGDAIQFTDLSYGSPTTWQWDFDNDGAIDSEEQNPEWIYNEPGIYTVSLIVSDGTNQDTETKIDYINVSSSGEEQQIELPTGYSFVSTRIIPENADFAAICDGILSNLDFARNSNGGMLRKIGPMWINGIGDWITTEGYLFKMNNTDELIITGDVIDPQTPVSLVEGYQFISYLPENPIDALDVFADVQSNLDFVRNSGGDMLRKIGPMWINGIGDMNPGEGYLVKMIDSDVLIYPSTLSSCGEQFIDIRDGKTYNTVLIGEQCWMAENLNIGEMINGTEEMTDNGVIERYCYDNNTSNCDEYGGLYQWDEMMQYTITPGVQGLCPEGWYIPTDDEWKILEGTVDSQYPVGDPIWNNFGSRGYDVGLNLKSTSGWYPNSNGTDLFGFTALPAGYRYHLGSFNNIEASANFWSSSDNNTTAWSRLLYYNSNEVTRGNPMKLGGKSVRCLKENLTFDNSSAKAKEQALNLSNTKIKSREAVHFNFEGGNAAEHVYTIYIDGLQIGDEVAAFDGDKIIGSVKINSKNAFENDLAVFSTINSGQGYQAGNPIQLKVYDSFTQKTRVAEYEMIDPYNEAYIQKVYPGEDGLYSIIKVTKGVNNIENTQEIISIFPNPSEGIFNISIEGLSGKVQLEVYDVHGNDYCFFEFEGTNTIITEKLDLKELPAGVYFVSFRGKDLTQVRKIVIQ